MTGETDLFPGIFSAFPKAFTVLFCLLFINHVYFQNQRFAKNKIKQKKSHESAKSNKR